MVLSTATAAADAYDPLRTTVGSGNDNILEYVVEDGAVEINSYLAIMPPAVTSADQTRAGKWQWCTGLNDPVCDPKNSPQSMKATSILPPCATAASENCIDSVEIGNATTMVKATLIRSTKGITFPPSPEYSYIGASTTSLWDAPGMPSSSGGTTYSVMPRIQSYFMNSSQALFPIKKLVVITKRTKLIRIQQLHHKIVTLEMVPKCVLGLRLGFVECHKISLMELELN